MRSLSSLLRARRAKCPTVTGLCPRMDLLVTSHPSRRRPSSMVWLSTTTGTPGGHVGGLGHPLLRSMRFSLWWLPSMAKHEKLERILHLRAKKYMWSIHRCDHSSLGHCNSGPCPLVYYIRQAFLRPPPPESHPVCHAYTPTLARLSQHSLQTSPHGPPPTRLLFIPPVSSHFVISAFQLRVRMNCTAAAHANLNFPFPPCHCSTSPLLPSWLECGQRLEWA